jgi:hypothetical protein
VYHSALSQIYVSCSLFDLATVAWPTRLGLYHFADHTNKDFPAPSLPCSLPTRLNLITQNNPKASQKVLELHGRNKAKTGKALRSHNGRHEISHVLWRHRLSCDVTARQGCVGSRFLLVFCEIFSDCLFLTVFFWLSFSDCLFLTVFLVTCEYKGPFHESLGALFHSILYTIFGASFPPKHLSEMTLRSI